MSRVLFILKRKEDYNVARDTHIGLSTGLYNSASFVNNMLNDLGIESALEVAIDNNCIDRLVTKHRPKFCIIEALWVVPEKFNILQKLHPDITWIIRLHSEMPFMAGEGSALNWIGEYSRFRNIVLAVNAPRMFRETAVFLRSMHGWSDYQIREKLIYLPNFYPQDYEYKKFDRSKSHVDVGCFGAVRPLKNHLLQAIAAIDFAESVGKSLHFHINAGRVEMQGQPALHNVQALFAHVYERGHRLINHTWAPREEFLITCSQMDIGMQCNFSETFNIVGADLISQGVPLIGSKEIPWLVAGRAKPNYSKNITKALIRAYKYPWLNVMMNQLSLTSYTSMTEAYWYSYFSE